jgi:hypothetical protein
VEQMNFILSTPIFIFLIIGLLVFIYGLFRIRKIKKLFTTEVLLVHGLFIGFFIAHTLFWYLAIFGSMGLNRVFITVLPLSTIIILNGLLFVEQKTKKLKYSNLFIPIMMGIFVLFQFSKNPSTIDFDTAFKLNCGKKTIKITLEDQDLIFNKAYTSDPYIGYLLDLNPFKNRLRSSKINVDDLLVWDSWYGPVEEGVSLKSLKNNTHLKKVFQINNDAGEPIYVGYIKVN